MVSYALYIKNVPEKEINLITICHRTASTLDRSWRTGWRASRPRTRTLRRPWRSATRGWRATLPPSARWDPWCSCWAYSTWQACTGEDTLDLMVPPFHWTGETGFDYFTCSFARTWSLPSADQVQCRILTCCVLRVSSSHLWVLSN
jgi:hypothetical protein